MRTLAGSRVWVAGHRGMAGAALLRRLERSGCTILTADHETLDLTNQRATTEWMTAQRPDMIFLAAARVGGIDANQRWPATFLLDNMLIVTNVVAAALAAGCRDLVYLSSSAAYPLAAPQPLREETLLDGAPDPSHAGYAAAKRAGIELCRQVSREHGVAYRAAIPTNLYGPGDHFGTGSHVVPALVRRFHEATVMGAPVVTLWGTGTPRRDLLFVDDLADACVTLAECSDEPLINVGSGSDVAIVDLAHAVAAAVGYTGELRFDAAKPDGAPRRLLATDRLTALGWQPATRLQDGLSATYRWFLNQPNHALERRGVPTHAGVFAED